MKRLVKKGNKQMKKTPYIEKRVARLAVYLGIAFGVIGTHGMAHAADLEILNPLSANSAQAPASATPYAKPKPLSLHNGDYMKETYRDVKVELIGPLNFTLDDDYSQKRFTNLSAKRGQSVRGPYETGAYIGHTHYSSIIAKTGFTLKF